MLRNVIKIIYIKGMSAKKLGHLHERNACVEVLQNIVLSNIALSLKSKPMPYDQAEDNSRIKKLIKKLLEV